MLKTRAITDKYEFQTTLERQGNHAGCPREGGNLANRRVSFPERFFVGDGQRRPPG